MHYIWIIKNDGFTVFNNFITFAQVQLENIRQKDNEVRWQHEDDADKCNGCKNPLGSNKKKKVRLGQRPQIGQQ